MRHVLSRFARAWIFGLCLALPSRAVEPGDASRPWPGVEFQSVRAYAWPASHDLESLVRPDLAVVPGAVDPHGKALDEKQIKRFITAVSRRKPAGRISLAGCYGPNYAFLLFDAGGRPVACVELSLRYHGCRVSPGAEDLEPHYGDLAALCVELGLPLPKDFSLDAYRREFEDTYIRGAGFEGAD